MNIPEQLKYTASHEWVRAEDDGTLSIGITDQAQEMLGDIVFLELPGSGRRYEKGEACAVVESVKAASDIYMPIAGDVIAVNRALADAPEGINANAYGAWIFRIRPAAGADTGTLLDAASYAALHAK